MKKLTLNFKNFLNIFNNDLYKIDKKYDANIHIFLDSIFYTLLNGNDIKFQEKFI